MSKGYQLADGSWSSEYKIGDRFVVGETANFREGSLIEFIYNDDTYCPYFELINGVYLGRHAKGENIAPASWKYLKKYPEKQNPFTKSDLKCGMRVTHRDGDEYYYVDDMFVDVADEPVNADLLDVFGTTEEYTEDLNHLRESSFDIIKVTDRDGTVLFERESIEQKLVLVTDEVREMTIGEIQARLGFHVKIVEG